MTLVTAQAPHITAHFVTSHRGFWHVYVLDLGYFRMTLVTALAPHITAHFVTSHRGFLIVGVDVVCRQCTECWVLPWKYNLHCCQAAKYLALLLTTLSVQYYEFVSLLFCMKNLSFYCNSKLPKTYTSTWSGTFILKDGRYTFTSFILSYQALLRFTRTLSVLFYLDAVTANVKVEKQVIPPNKPTNLNGVKNQKTVFYILIYIQQDATLHSLFYLKTTLHVSGGTITHHQERKQLYLQHLVFVMPLLLYAVGGVRHPQHTQTCSNSSTIAADSSKVLTNTRCCRYSCMRSWWWVMLPPGTCRAVSRKN
jgi:hypothetical protein